MYEVDKDVVCWVSVCGMGGWNLGPPLLVPGVVDPGRFADRMLVSLRDAGNMYGGSGELGSAAAATVLATQLLDFEVLEGSGDEDWPPFLLLLLLLRWLFM